MPTDTPSSDKMRLDKWLWAARFFKTRTLATQAIEHGRVRLAGERVKPAREVRAGDRLDLRVGDADWTVIVLGLASQRRPAPEAQALYAETDESRARREAQRAERRLAVSPAEPGKGRPTKRDRRLIHRFTAS